MSEKGFLSWNDKQLKTLVLNLVAQGEQWEKISAQTGFVDALIGGGSTGAVNWQRVIISNALYAKAVVVKLERLNKRIDELVQAMKH